MRICVVGGAGYLGSVLVPALTELGHEVIVIDPCLYDQAEPNVECIRRLVLSGQPRTWDVLSSCQAVFWLSAFAHDPAHLINPRLIHINNCITPLHYARRLSTLENPPLFVVPSSLSIFSDCQADAYPKSKWTLESELFQLPNYQRFVSILRFGTLYGPSSVTAFRAHLLMNSLSIQALSGKSLNISSTTVRRPILTIDQAVVKLAQELDKAPRGTLSNIYDTSGTLEQFAHTVADAAGVSRETVVNRPSPDQRDYGWGRYRASAVTNYLQRVLFPYLRANLRFIQTNGPDVQRSYYEAIKTYTPKMLDSVSQGI